MPNANSATIKLQRQIDACVEWADDWKVAVNASKSAAVLFTRRRKRPTPLKVGPVKVPWAESLKYLELHIDYKLTSRTHTREIRKRASAQISRLWPVLSSPAMTPRLGKTNVNTYVLPVITFAAPVWGYLAATHRKSLQSVLDRGLKLAAKVPRRFSSRVLRKGL